MPKVSTHPITRIVGYSIMVNGREKEQVESNREMPRHSATQAMERAAEVAMENPRSVIAVEVLTETA